MDVLATPTGHVLARVMKDEDEEGFLCAKPGGSEAMILGDGEQFEVVPERRPQVAQHIHVSGPSGCGKSTWSGNFAKLWRAMNKDGRVIVISADARPDPAIGCDARIAVTPELADLQLESIAGDFPLLVIFDDIEGLSNVLTKAVQTFQQALLERGRKYSVSTINIFHRAANGSATKSALAEATAFLVFPDGGCLSGNTAYALKRYCGVPPEFLTIVRRSGGWGRWLYICNSAPQVAIGERRAAVLDTSTIEALARAERKRANKEAEAALENLALTSSRDDLASVFTDRTPRV